jgi:transposase
MWKPEHRRAADRSGLRYPSDLIDAEWLIVEPMIPSAKRGGRRRSVNVREVLNGIFHVLWTGCQWKALAKDLPPKSTVHDYLELWNWDGTLCHHRCCLRPSRDPHYAQAPCCKPFVMNPNFPDRLLDGDRSIRSALAERRANTPTISCQLQKALERGPSEGED